MSRADLRVRTLVICLNENMAGDLNPNEKLVLRDLAEYGTVRGFELKKRLKLDSQQLVDAVKPLIQQRLITPSGVVACETIDRVLFSPLSSILEKMPYIS